MAKDVLILIGCGEHARAVMEAASGFQVGGYIDREKRDVSAPWLGHEDDFLSSFEAETAATAHFVLGFAGVKFSPVRRTLAERFEARGARFATVIHERAWVSPSAAIAAGVVIMAGAIINAKARIGRHAVVNTGSVIEHDVVLGDFASVASGVVVSGGAQLGAMTYVGPGACIRDHIKIGTRVNVAPGGVVLADVADDTRV